MKILFYFGHPSQYLFLRNAILLLRGKGINCEIIIKSKDILEKLLAENNEHYINILPEGRKSNKLGLLTGLIKRIIRLWKYVRKNKFNLLIGTDPSLAHIGFVFNIPVITVLEDDIDVIPDLAKLTYPFTSLILTPTGCKVGKFERKAIHYDGYMKLAYLHPNRYIPKAVSLKQPYFLLRVSRLDAYHDKKAGGFSYLLIKEIAKQLVNRGSVYISSEGTLHESLKGFELQIKPSEMQDVLANSEMLISNSQSMSMEAAMLGIPSIRFSDFSGKISVLEELEHVYGLTFGIPTEMPGMLFKKIAELLSISNLKDEFGKRRQRMLDDKIDVTSFMVWFIENYPESFRIMKDDPKYQLRFK
jgi:uncharacterized protein